MLSEVFAHRLVITFQDDVSGENADGNDSQGYMPCLRESEFVLPYPCVKEIHERVVDHIDGIGYVAEKFADLPAASLRNATRCREADNSREYQEHAERVVETVHPSVLLATDMRDGKQNDQHQAAPPKDSFNLDGFQATA